MDLNEAQEVIGKGWWPLLEKFWDMTAILSVRSNIEVIKVGHRIGMLAIETKADDPMVQEMLKRLVWSLERDSARFCEVCGEKGFRRKTLPGSPNRCREHYVQLANEMAERGEI